MRTRAASFGQGGVKARPPLMQVRVLNANAALGRLEYGALRFPVAVGRSGVRAAKREGDGATPRGIWRTVRVYYRADRVRRPVTGLPIAPVRPADGWCDAARDRNYNRAVTLPYTASAERMWRRDGLYDIVVVLDYNLSVRIAGRGSAIFIHIARPAFTPTEGCIAIRREHMLRLLAALKPCASIGIGV